MRIGIALVVLVDLCIRWGDIGAFYTDAGIWPRRLVTIFSWDDGFWSAHLLSGTLWWQAMLFTLHGLCALALLVGFRTKLFTLLTWAFTVSLHNRNVFILQSGDDLLRLVLFWGLFLPWGACYSLDEKKNTVSPRPTLFASLGYLFLIASLYFFSVMSKTSPEWRSEGTAIYYALSLEQIRLPYSGDLLYSFPGLMTVLTHIVFYIELLIPLLILWPSTNKNIRLSAFVLIILLHVGISLTLFVGLFPLISAVSAIGLLPGSLIEKTEQKFGFGTTQVLHHRKSRRYYWFSNSLVALLIFICLLINFERLKWFNYEARSELRYVINTLRLNQNWGMFSPDVLKKDGWLVYYGNDSIGRQWDLRLNQDYVDFSKPKHIVSMYKNDRWRKLAEYMQNDHYNFLRPAFCRYTIRQWNVRHPEKNISLLYLYFMEKQNLPGYKTSTVKKCLYCVCNGS